MKSFGKVIDIIKKWNDILDSAQKRRSIHVFFAIIVSSLLEMLGVSVIMPFITAMMDADALLQNKYTIFFAEMTDIELNDANIVFVLAVMVVLVYVAKNVGLAWTDYVSLRYENQIMKDFSFRMLKSYMYRPYEDSLDINSAEVLRGIGMDATALYYIIQSVFKIIANGLTILLIGIFMISTDPFMALCIVMISGGLSFFILLALKKTIRKSGRDFNQSMLDQNKTAMQALGALKELTIMNRRDQFLKYNEESLETKRKAEIKYRFLQLFPHRIIETIFIGSIMGIVGIRFFMGWEVTGIIPQLAVFAIAAIRILPLVNSIIGLNTTIIYYAPSFNNAYSNIMASKEHTMVEIFADNDYGGIIEFKETLTVENVTWKYRRAEHSTFDNVNIQIHRGEAVGIIGPSGAGKTTLADIILGLLAPQKGRILLDGEDIRHFPTRWSKMIGYVPQTVYLLDDTIRNNVLFGIKGEEASDDKVWEALEQACLNDFIETLPNGLDTIVGERGAKISGGQRQRIAIARALYYNPEILVLDEATSALDQETESAVMEAVEQLQGKKTLIIIAHRFSTLEKCDRIFEVNEGKVFESRLH